MDLTIEFDREDDGRWIAEVVEIPGALAYGLTREAAAASAQAIALRTLADRLEHGECGARPLRCIQSRMSQWRTARRAGTSRRLPERLGAIAQRPIDFLF